MSILVLGTLALDTVKTPAGERKDILGGSAAHFAMSARFFTRVSLAAIIGGDFPKKYINFLADKGIGLSSLVVGKGRSFRWQGEYKGNLNTAITINTELGVLSVFKPRITEQERRIKYLFLANIDPDIQRYVLKSMRGPKLVALDSMNYWIENKRASLRNLLSQIDIYLANENEARELSGEYNLVKASRCLRKLGPAMIVIKKGEHGVLFYSDKFIFSLPAYPVYRLVDPTGAGDTFAGGFMGYLAKAGCLKDKEIRKAIAYGVAAASFNVEDFGLRKMSRVKKEEIDARVNALWTIKIP